jgi:hypothetical protein
VYTNTHAKRRWYGGYITIQLVAKFGELSTHRHKNWEQKIGDGVSLKILRACVDGCPEFMSLLRTDQDESNQSF